MLLKVATLEQLLDSTTNTNNRLNSISNALINTGMRYRVEQAYPNISDEDLNNKDLVESLFWNTVSDEDINHVNKIYPTASAGLGALIGGITGAKIAKKHKLITAAGSSLVGSGIGYGAGTLLNKPITEHIRKNKELFANRGKYVTNN